MLNVLLKQKQNKNLMMFPVLIGKTKMFNHIHYIKSEKGGGLPISISKCQWLGSVIQILLTESQISKFIL